MLGMLGIPVSTTRPRELDLTAALISLVTVASVLFPSAPAVADGFDSVTVWLNVGAQGCNGQPHKLIGKPS